MLRTTLLTIIVKLQYGINYILKPTNPLLTNPPPHHHTTHNTPKTGSRFAVDFPKSTEDNEPVPPLN